MDIHEFITKAPTELLAFKARYIEVAAEEGWSLDRSESDWWREVAAYMQYVELEESFQKE